MAITSTHLPPRTPSLPKSSPQAAAPPLIARLPVELLASIITQSAPPPDFGPSFLVRSSQLRHCALVSRTWGHIARLELHQHPVVASKRAGDLLCLHLAGWPHKAAWVRTLRIDGEGEARAWRGSGIDDGRAPELVKLCPRLGELWLRNFDFRIDGILFGSLRRLHLAGCSLRSTLVHRNKSSKLAEKNLHGVALEDDAIHSAQLPFLEVLACTAAEGPSSAVFNFSQPPSTPPVPPRSLEIDSIGGILAPLGPQLKALLVPSSDTLDRLASILPSLSSLRLLHLASGTIPTESLSLFSRRLDVLHLGPQVVLPASDHTVVATVASRVVAVHHQLPSGSDGEAPTTVEVRELRQAGIRWIEVESRVEGEAAVFEESVAAMRRAPAWAVD